MSNDNQTAFIYFGSKNNIVNAKKASLTAKITLGLLTLTYSREFIYNGTTQVWNYTDVDPNQSMIAIYNTGLDQISITSISNPTVILSFKPDPDDYFAIFA